MYVILADFFSPRVITPKLVNIVCGTVYLQSFFYLLIIIKYTNIVILAGFLNIERLFLLKQSAITATISVRPSSSFDVKFFTIWERPYLFYKILIFNWKRNISYLTKFPLWSNGRNRIFKLHWWLWYVIFHEKVKQLLRKVS